MRKALLIAVIFSGCATQLSGEDYTTESAERIEPSTGFEENLVIDPLQSNETEFLQIPLTGKAPKNSTLLLSVNGISSEYTLSQNPDFCINVDLVAGVENILSIEALKINGERSESFELRVFQSGEPPSATQEAEPPPPRVNVGSSAHNIQQTVSFEDGYWVDAEMLTSPPSHWQPLFQNPAASTHICNSFWAGEDFFNFDISTNKPIGSIQITAGDNSVLQDVEIYYSDIESSETLFNNIRPAIPLQSQSINEEWKLWGKINEGNSQQTVSLHSPNDAYGTEVKRIALAFRDFEFLGRGHHTIKSIDIWAINEQTQTQEGYLGPTCENGGSF